MTSKKKPMQTQKEFVVNLFLASIKQDVYWGKPFIVCLPTAKILLAFLKVVSIIFR
jgi:hypothetical protein